MTSEEQEKQSIARSTKYFIAAFTAFVSSILCITFGGLVLQAIGFALIAAAGHFHGKSQMLSSIENGEITASNVKSAEITDEEMDRLERITGKSLEDFAGSGELLEIDLNNVSEDDMAFLSEVFGVDFEQAAKDHEQTKKDQQEEQ